VLSNPLGKLQVKKVGQDFNWFAQQTYIGLANGFRKRYRAMIQEYNAAKPALTPTGVIECLKESEEIFDAKLNNRVPSFAAQTPSSPVPMPAASANINDNNNNNSQMVEAEASATVA